MDAHYARADWRAQSSVARRSGCSSLGTGRHERTARCKMEVRVIGFTHMMCPLSGARHKHGAQICLPRACYRASRTRDACVLTAAFAPWFCQCRARARGSGGDDGRGAPWPLGCCPTCSIIQHFLLILLLSCFLMDAYFSQLPTSFVHCNSPTSFVISISPVLSFRVLQPRPIGYPA
ncbi:hypothetical protein F5148DRAFT_1193904 [Russula earlei]|uniref:Uncharacterized protein n=1 Tax=Russula earlei TaxID=71964 RepID=A0ACC0UAI6_9AGAM|nr:hypothetical protein F5148DRAFT_1193904 [Russula earlei]